MPVLGLLIVLPFVMFVGINTLLLLWKYIKTRQKIYLRKLGFLWVVPSIIIGFVLYSYYPITKDRVIGLYEIDNNFYPGPNANWQKEHFSFEITKEGEFLFKEKLKDGSVKVSSGKIHWYRKSPPMLYRIFMREEHPLIDTYPALYRGKRRHYYVFETKFGNMFYRKVK